LAGKQRVQKISNDIQAHLGNNQNDCAERKTKMGNLGFTEILLIGIALLIFFGPSRLPELGKSLGKGIQEFKKASREITDAVKESVSEGEQK
jgi:sec-independent protein translocase protein TatA